VFQPLEKKNSVLLRNMTSAVIFWTISSTNCRSLIKIRPNPISFWEYSLWLNRRGSVFRIPLSLDRFCQQNGSTASVDYSDLIKISQAVFEKMTCRVWTTRVHIAFCWKFHALLFREISIHNWNLSRIGTVFKKLPFVFRSRCEEPLFWKQNVLAHWALTYGG
jgi:hypothetical protein